jgi:hypothetical protein
MSTASPTTTGGLKICVVSNYYPPHFIGGYELGCRDVVEALRGRGHQVRVLTSTYNVEKPHDDGVVHRRLKIGDWWTPNSLGGLAAVINKEMANLRAFRKICSDFHPDLIYVWNPVGISLSLVSVSQRLGLPVAFSSQTIGSPSGRRTPVTECGKNSRWNSIDAFLGERCCHC